MSKRMSFFAALVLTFCLVLWLESEFMAEDCLGTWQADDGTIIRIQEEMDEKRRSRVRSEISWGKNRMTLVLPLKLSSEKGESLAHVDREGLYQSQDSEMFIVYHCPHDDVLVVHRVDKTFFGGLKVALREGDSSLTDAAIGRYHDQKDRNTEADFHWAIYAPVEPAPEKPEIQP